MGKVTILFLVLMILIAGMKSVCAQQQTSPTSENQATPTGGARSESDAGDVTYSEHDKSVYFVVFNRLEVEFSKSPGATVGDRIKIAMAGVNAERNEPDKSTDIILRDAEYYLMGLGASATSDIQSEVALLGTPAWDVAKYAAYKLKDLGYPWVEEYLRSNKSNPISPPGGWEWAYRGLLDGLKIPGSVATRGLIDLPKAEDRIKEPSLGGIVIIVPSPEGYTDKWIDGFPRFRWLILIMPAPPRNLRVVP